MRAYILSLMLLLGASLADLESEFEKTFARFMNESAHSIVPILREGERNAIHTTARPNHATGNSAARRLLRNEPLF